MPGSHINCPRCNANKNGLRIFRCKKCGHIGCGLCLNGIGRCPRCNAEVHTNIFGGTIWEEIGYVGLALDEQRALEREKTEAAHQLEKNLKQERKADELRRKEEQKRLDEQRRYEEERESEREYARREAQYKIDNPGDYECPCCHYRTLKRNASRCPKCIGQVESSYWDVVNKRETEAQERQRIQWELDRPAREEKQAKEKANESAAKWSFNITVAAIFILNTPWAISLWNKGRVWDLIFGVLLSSIIEFFIFRFMLNFLLRIYFSTKR